MGSIEDIDAIYEDGVIRPIHPLKGISEHSRLKVSVSPLVEGEGHTLASCLGTISQEDAQQMTNAIDEAFEKVDLSEWK